MKKFMFALLILFYSCGSNQENKSGGEDNDLVSAENIELSGNYMIRNIRAENVASEKIELKFDSTRQEFSGNAGCNRFSSGYERSGIKVTFKPVVSTKMYCEGKMEMESAITEILPEITQMVLQNGELVFINENLDPLLTIEKIK
ncbi:META domain-containing protein [Antarcticibacterium arcticum]|uniref:META domain-containing protein n=1 Tax=Antarcticibacterium arcticum TaxID=2585771 RepID=A0A5B8YPT2_9FLAO|nr:META domain-containing protein [Antarcticibacterium arcticum]QED38336.1 META domain-containing protein [Antarcticibacterium arcticum]